MEISNSEIENIIEKILIDNVFHKGFPKDVNLFELGLDSIMIAILGTKIEKDFNIELPVTILYKNQTFDELIISIAKIINS